jgi:hypothetical protein
MNEAISCCGLICNTCPIFIASREPDIEKKGKMIWNIIDTCKTNYGTEYKYEEINDCDGCKSGSGRLFFGCRDCKIRECVNKKEIDNCAYCKEYPCSKLMNLFKQDEGAKTRLDYIKSNLNFM